MLEIFFRRLYLKTIMYLYFFWIFSCPFLTWLCISNFTTLFGVRLRQAAGWRCPWTWRPPTSAWPSATSIAASRSSALQVRSSYAVDSLDARHICKPYFYIREQLYSRPLSSFPYILHHCHLWRLSSLHENSRIVKLLYFFSFQVTLSLPSTCIPGRPSSRAHCPPSPTWPSTTHTPSTGTHWYSWIFWHQATSTDVFARLLVCVYHHFIWLQSKKRKRSNKYLSQKCIFLIFPKKRHPPAKVVLHLEFEVIRSTRAWDKLYYI